MQIETYIDSLISYAMNRGLAQTEDHMVLQNRLLEVLGKDDRHVVVKVIAAVQLQILVLLGLKPIEAHRVVEVVEALSDGHRRGREDNALHLGHPALRQVCPDIQLLRHQLLLADPLSLSIELSRVDHVVLRRDDDVLDCVRHL